MPSSLPSFYDDLFFDGLRFSERDGSLDMNNDIFLDTIAAPSSLEAETAQTIDVDKINEVGSQPVLNDPKLTDDQRWLLKSGMLDLLSVADVHNPDPFEEMSVQDSFAGDSLEEL